MNKNNILSLVLLFITLPLFAQNNQLDLILVGPGQRQDMQGVVQDEFVHGESASLSIAVDYYRAIASDNAQRAERAKRARENFERQLDKH
jgi:hypothetical protein